MSKKSTSDMGTTADSTDAYWLACIARHQSDMEAKAKDQVAAAKSYAPSPADSFWLKHADVRDSKPVTAAVNDTRVGIPAHIVYTAAIDDGRTRHVAWSIRNMSLSGVLLDMDVNRLHEDSTVEFLLRYRLADRVVDCRIPAKVVRTQLNGLALRFGSYDAPTCQGLAELLYPA